MIKLKNRYNFAKRFILYIDNINFKTIREMKVGILLTTLCLSVVTRNFANTSQIDSLIINEQDVVMQQYEASIDRLVTTLESTINSPFWKTDII